MNINLNRKNDCYGGFYKVNDNGELTGEFQWGVPYETIREANLEGWFKQVRVGEDDANQDFALVRKVIEPVLAGNVVRVTVSYVALTPEEIAARLAPKAL